jgi:hypothetical protein
MGLLHHVEPLAGVRLALDDLVARLLGEDLRAAPRQGVEPGLLELREHLLHRHAVETVEEEDLDGGEGLDVDVRPRLLDPPHHVQEVRPGQIGVQPPHDVDLAHGPGQRGHVLEDLLEAHRVGPRLPFLGGEGAEVAGGHADVRVVDVGVPDEVGGVAVPLLADVVGQGPDGQQVMGPV